MSATTSPPRRSHAAKSPKKPFWKRDLSSLGNGSATSDEEVEHPPFEPTLPRIDVLPDKVRESFLVKRIIRSLVIVALLVAAAFGTLWYLQGSSIELAQTSLADAQAQNAQLQANAEALVPVTQMFTEITDQKALVDTTLASQPQADAVLERLQAAGRKVVAFDSISAQYNGIPTPGGVLNACPKADPFVVDVTVGCVTFTATAPDRADVTKFLTNLQSDPFFVGPYINMSSVTEDKTSGASTVTFNGTAGVSTFALVQPLSEEQIATLKAPPSPTATPVAGG
jgi:hypothetical protein